MTLPKNIPELDDRQLIELVKSDSVSKSKAAKAAIYERYVMDVYCVIQSKVHNEAVAKDITMDTWEYVLREIYQFEWAEGDGNKLKSWLFRIAHIKRLEHFRTNPDYDSLDDLSETQRQARQYIACRLEDFEEDDGEALDGDVAKVADRILQKSLDSLSAIQREIILLRYYQGVETFAEIANMLGFPPGKTGETRARVYHTRALKKLAQSPLLDGFVEG